MAIGANPLGAAFDFIRVDLYDVDGEVWFSELTPYPGAGLAGFDPALDRRLGALWQLPPRLPKAVASPVRPPAHPPFASWHQVWKSRCMEGV